MEHKLDELLKQLHRYLFADSEQVIVELRHYMLDRSLKEADLGTCPNLFCVCTAFLSNFDYLCSVRLVENLQLQ